MTTIERFVLDGMGFTDAQIELTQKIRELEHLTDVAIEPEETWIKNAGFPTRAHMTLKSKLKAGYDLETAKKELIGLAQDEPRFGILKPQENYTFVNYIWVGLTLYIELER